MLVVYVSPSLYLIVMTYAVIADPPLSGSGQVITMLEPLTAVVGALGCAGI